MKHTGEWRDWKSIIKSDSDLMRHINQIETDRYKATLRSSPEWKAMLNFWESPAGRAFKNKIQEVYDFKRRETVYVKLAIFEILQMKSKE